MKVEAIGHPQSLRKATEVTPLARREAKLQAVTVKDIARAPDGRVVELGSPVSTIEPVGPAAEPIPFEGTREREGTRAKGVLRNLEAGHFKGVADVRLRINFFDELSARAGGVAQAAAVEASTSLFGAVAEGAGELLNPFATDENTRQELAGLIDEFSAAVNRVTGETLAAGGFDIDAFSASIQDAFAAFVEQAGSLLAPVVADPEPPPDPDIGPDDAASGARPDGATLGTKGDGLATLANDQVSPRITGAVDAPDTVIEPPAVQPPPSFDDAIASLVAVFDEALATLTDSMSAVATLPEPFAPSGNGVAYDKFLEMYNALRGVSTDLDRIA